MNLMRDIGAFILGLGFLIAGSGFAYGYVQKAAAPEAPLGGDAFAEGQSFYMTGAVVDSGQRSATTTNVYLATGDTASSTITGQLVRGQRINLNLRAVASSSAAILRWAVDTSPNGVDWYSFEDATTTASMFDYAYKAGDARYTWNLSTSTDAGTCGTNEVCKSIFIDDVIGSKFRIRFGVSGANAAVWGEARVVEPVPN